MRSHPDTILDAAAAADELMTPAEAAKELRLAKNTLRTWRSDGRYDLPYLKIGGKVFYRRSVVEAVKQHGLKKRGKVRMEGAV